MTFTSSTLRVAKYLRVSTTRQAEADLSIPDQDRQADAFCQTKGWQIAACFTEPGASATDDRRPEFQRMIDQATGPDRPFDVILVHSMSRFFRDQFQSEFYIRKLRKARVQVVSITQQFNTDPTGELIRKIIGNFDEYQSQENAKHTLRAMRENARQGFWNGSTTPFGYTTEITEQRGNKAKKRLVIEPNEAIIVRRIFDAALGRSGPALGVKAIAASLNANGFRLRGKLFAISNVHRILTRRTYAGTHHFNRTDSRTRERKAAEEWDVLQVPALISVDDFETIQASLASRNPKRTPPRVVSGPTLLTGLAICSDCGGGMTIRTGKGGRYRYYTCAGRAQKGGSACAGRSTPMAALDGMVIEHLADRLFTAERLTNILKAYIAQSADDRARRRQKSGLAKQRLTEIKTTRSRLLDLVASGVMEADDDDLKEKITALNLQRRNVEDEIAPLEAASRATDRRITPQQLEGLAWLMRETLQTGDAAVQGLPTAVC